MIGKTRKQDVCEATENITKNRLDMTPAKILKRLILHFCGGTVDDLRRLLYH